MKRVVNIVIWALFAVIVFLVGLRYLYLGMNEPKTITVLIGVIMVVVSGSMVKETISWIKKTN